jgi:hypothetical protein
MRQIGSLLAAVLLLAVVTAAQGPAGAGAGSGSGSRSRTSALSTSDFDQWQLAVGYQYNRINLLGTPFNTDGLNVTVTRFFGRWFGLDAQLGTGFFGNTGTTSNPPNLGVHSLFIGGGPRLAFRGRSRIEPWVHAVIGLQDFRFTQTAGLLGSNQALGGAGGGGADFAFTPHLALRVEADVLETRFFSTYQRHFQVVGGFVVNF